jgi:hypothetical protein
MLRPGTLALLFFFLSQPAFAQLSATLKTRDTLLLLRASSAAPSVTELRDDRGFIWRNRSPEQLLSSVEREGNSIPIHWTLNLAASRVAANRVAFVYDSSVPPLRLTWEWRAPADFGPLEHAISVENRGPSEIWLPLQPSFQFDFAVPSSLALEHFYVEKGADTPSAEGTHLQGADDRHRRSCRARLGQRGSESHRQRISPRHARTRRLSRRERL